MDRSSPHLKIASPKAGLLRLSPYLVLVLSLSMTLYFWHLYDASLKARAFAGYNRQTEAIGDHLYEELRDCEQILLGVAGLFNAGTDINRDQWRRYATTLNLRESHRGIQAIGFSKWLTSKEENLRKIRSEGFPAYATHPEGVRPSHTSIIYLEPFDWRNQQAFGYDMFSEPVRRAAMEKARDSGKTAIATNIILLPETEKGRENGILMYIPVYRQGMATDTVENRRKAISGFAFCALRSNDFIYATLGKAQGDIAFDFFAADAEQPDALIFSSRQAGKLVLRENFRPTYQSRRSDDAFGRKWLISFKTLPAFDTKLLRVHSLLVLSAGLMVSLLMTIIAFMLLASRNRSVEAVRALGESETRFKNAFRYSAIGMSLVSLEGTWLKVNSSLCSMLGYAEEELLAMKFRDITHPEYHASDLVYRHQMLVGEMETFSQEKRYFHKQGQIIWVHSAVALVRDSDGLPLCFIAQTQDITERKRVEADRDNLIAILEATTDLVSLSDPAGRLIYLNRAGRNLLGVDLQEDITETVIADFIPDPATHPMLTQGILAAVRLGSWTGETVLLSRSGREFPVSLVILAHKTPDGKLESLSTIMRDITESKKLERELLDKNRDLVLQASLAWDQIVARKQAEEMAIEARNDWERTFDALPDMIAIIDLNHIIRRVNRSMAKGYDIAPEELVGRKCHEVMHCLPRPHADCPHVRMMRDGVGCSQEVEVKGLASVFDITVSPLYDAQGVSTGCVHVARDITERKQMARLLAENEIRLRTLLQTIPDQIWLKDLDGRYLFCNRMFERFFGAKESDIVGKTDYDFVDRDLADFFRERDLKAIAAGELYGDGVWHTFADNGQRSLLETIKMPMYDSEGSLVGVLGVARDITERRQAQEKNLEIERKFQQTQKLESLGVLAGGIAHDFNNILTIIQGHCYIVDKDIDSGMDLKTHVRQIGNAAGRAADLCRQMLTYAGRNSLVQTRIDLRLMVDENVKMLKSGIKKNVGFELYLEHEVSEVVGDAAQIQQVVMNLIINAAEAIGEKSGTIKIELQAVALAGKADRDFLDDPVPAGEYACLTVADNGCGMDEETHKRLFEPFYTTKFAGRGLGMSAVLGIIKAHNGALQLSSRPGAGTTFKVYFPLPAVPTVVETSVPAGAVPLLKGSGVILLVDDEEALRGIGSLLLKEMGYAVLTARNGREALQIYRERGSGIDLILLDLLMPEMGGVQAYRFLREISSSVPIVLCSGYSIEDIMEDITGDEHVETIEKPYNPDKLRNTLARLLGERGQK